MKQQKTTENEFYNNCLEHLTNLQNDGFQEVRISWTKKHQLLGMVEMTSVKNIKDAVMFLENYVLLDNFDIITERV